MTLIQSSPKKIYIRVELQPVTTAGIYHSPEQGLISLSSNGNTWITIADKNLGATQVYNDGDTLSEANCGKFYQRGNNYGFAWTGIVSFSYNTVDASSYGPGNYYSSSTFIINSPNWCSPGNANLWGETTGTNEARQGPCPSGFHVPTYNDWNTIKGVFTWSETRRKQLKLPLAGYRDTYNKNTNAGSFGQYWTTLCNANNGTAYMFQFGNTTTAGYNDCYLGYSIRPFANTPVQPDETRTVLYQ